MKRFFLSDEDSLVILPPENDEGAVLEIVSGNTVMFFAFSQIEEAGRQRNVHMDVRSFDALLLVATDVLLGEKQRLLIPETHADHAALLQALRSYAPTLEINAESVFRLEQCGHGEHPA